MDLGQWKCFTVLFHVSVEFQVSGNCGLGSDPSAVLVLSPAWFLEEPLPGEGPKVFFILWYIVLVQGS